MGDYTSSEGRNTAFTPFKSHFSATRPHSQVNVLEAIRNVHPDKHVTAVEPWNADLIEFSDAGHAKAVLRRDGSEYTSSRTYSPPRSRMEEGEGKLGEDILFGLYEYTYGTHNLLVYFVEWPGYCGGFDRMQYILTPKESIAGRDHCPIADSLVKAAGKWSSQLNKQVYVFDSGRWDKSELLWEAVQSASWDDVILDPAMKDTLINDVESFFDSRVVYEEYSVPWKRGIIFHGTPGCGKTITIKALMNSLQKRNVASLYVKSFEAKQGLQYSIREIFEQARIMAPCLLIFEDLDSLVVNKVRSYFLNEVDGLEKNDGILMLGSTNHLERLDPGISKRPSRFDRKYHYKLPGEKERILYCEYWRNKLQKNSKIEFNHDICKVVAQFTEGFSFAYLKELFVQTLLCIVGGRADIDDDEDDAYINVTDAVEKTKIVEGSSSLVKEGEAVETTDDAEPAAKAAAEVKPERKMPEVEIPEHLKSNSLMLILHKQAKALWKDMDSSEDEVHSRSKVASGGDEEDDSDDDDMKNEDYTAQLRLLEMQNAHRLAMRG